MTDFVQLIVDMRSGQVANDLNAKFNEVLGAVLETGGKGKLTIELNISPSRMGLGGAVLEIETSHECKMKKPQYDIGKSVFFVDKQGNLTRVVVVPYAMWMQWQETILLAESLEVAVPAEQPTKEGM